MLAVSGNQTFVIYLYDDIQWSREGKAFAGYISGDGRTIFEIDGSFNTSIEEIESTTNVGKPGLWVFRVDDPVYLSCQDSATGFPTIQLILQNKRIMMYMCNLHVNTLTQVCWLK